MSKQKRVPRVLHPRVVAVLCCLRQGSRTIEEIHVAVGDYAILETEDLLSPCRAGGLVAKMIRNVVEPRWFTDSVGLEWYEINGLGSVYD
jgi:hypothetical protein